MGAYSKRSLIEGNGINRGFTVVKENSKAVVLSVRFNILLLEINASAYLRSLYRFDLFNANFENL